MRKKKTASKKPAELQSEPKPVFIRSQVPGFVSLYTNKTMVRTSGFDVRFLFGVVGEASGDVVQINEVAELHMSPEHAKQLTSILVRQLAEYESRVGPIPMEGGEQLRFEVIERELPSE